MRVRLIVRNEDNSTDLKQSRINFYNPNWEEDYDLLMKELAVLPYLQPSDIFTTEELYVLLSIVI